MTREQQIRYRSHPLSLSPAQIAAREGKLTASSVACLMTGDAEKILNLWRELTGDPSYVREDLSDVWPVQLGSHTESLNLAWYTRRTGRALTRAGEVVVHPIHDWAACTLDAWDAELNACVECKHVGGFEKLPVILERYAPQAHWQMICTGSDKCVFSVIEGAREPSIEMVDRDKPYAKELWKRAEQFMECVNTLTPPVVLPAIAAPVKAEKTYEMTGNNQWGSEAVTWLTTKQAAKDFAAAEKVIKKIVPADAIICTGHGIKVSRNKAGSLSIKETGE
jgi:predicted phage-related endonuclease